MKNFENIKFLLIEDIDYDKYKDVFSNILFDPKDIITENMAIFQIFKQILKMKNCESLEFNKAKIGSNELALKIFSMTMQINSRFKRIILDGNDFGFTKIKKFKL